jgi:hypothetical protein
MGVMKPAPPVIKIFFHVKWEYVDFNRDTEFYRKKLTALSYGTFANETL